MIYSREIGFVISAIATALILYLVPVDDAKVAGLRLESALNAERTLKDDIGARCTQLLARRTPADPSAEEKLFIERFGPPAQVGEVRGCTVSVVSAVSNRFFLRSYSNYLIRVQGDTGQTFLERNFHVQYPRPLALLPIALFLLALIFEFEPWGIGATLVTYVFFLGGGSAIHACELLFSSALLTMTGDTTFLGLVMIVLWLSLFLSRRTATPVPSAAMSTWERATNFIVSFTVGLWSPTVFTLFGRLITPLKGTVSRVMPFLDAQVGLACLSLYLLSIDTKQLADIAEKSLLLPRYFSFSALLFIGLTHLTRRPRRQVSLYRLPRLWCAVLAVAIAELLPLKFAALAEIPTLLRIGTALLVSELVLPLRLSPKRAARMFFPWVGMLFLGSLLAVITQGAGMSDLALSLSEPRVHPTTFIFFTFLAGLAMGFLTGSFAAPFFTLLLFVKAHEVPQARAALLDGILAGNLLSPFSLFNLIPSIQFGIPLPRLIAIRWKQLAIPLGIGSVIYAVSTINSVAILQPVTFVFLCLVAIAFQLKKRTWTVGSFHPPEYSGT